MAYSREIEKLERQFNENPRRFAAPFADALRKSEEVARALEVIQVGLELNPDYIPGSVILGRCHLDLGNDDGAEAAFSRVLDLDNENVIALKSLADIMERQGRNDEAVRFLTYLLEVDRSNDEAREQLTRIQAVPVASRAPSPPPPAPPEPAPEPVYGAPPGDTAADAPAAVEEFLEPTALWEAPAEVEEASISSWVEPTAADPLAPPEDSGSILASTGADEEVAPVDGFESDNAAADGARASYEEFVLEREEEIILTSMAGAEYQVANDSETLLGPTDPPAPEEPPPVAAEEPAVPGPPSVIAEELGSAAPPEAEPADVPEAGGDEEEEEAPFAWAMHVAEKQEFVPAEPTHAGSRAPDSFDAAIAGIAPVDEEEALDDEEAEPVAESDEEPVLVVTESMAELYATQGHPTEALGVYRILYDRNPANERLRTRIQELESTLAELAGANAAPSFAASVTGGKAVAAFLGGMLGSRPAPVDLPEPPRVEDVAKSDDESGESADEATASGAPTRPAIDRLSLGAIFGEDPSPVPPAANAPAADKADGAGGFSFDDFFGGGAPAPTGRTSAGSVRAARPADDEEDLDQFHVWLQSLKR
ncbi:MAG TPA: hypothetical protein VFV65_01705 [Gemmatimonadales bacterium]|nr:hypothetical protein [Gemmatimonadales bacterium]